MSLPRLIIVRKRAVKRILSWREFYRNVIAAISRIWIIHAAVILSPVLVPAAYAIWNWIIRRRFFTDPEDCRYDLGFPRETLSRGHVSGQLAGGERD